MKNIFTIRHCDKMKKLKTGMYITTKKKKTSVQFIRFHQLKSFNPFSLIACFSLGLE